ncbi:neutral zinc metallopeptidase [Micromonospora sp. NPDC005979]|uniref:KPN_02809 family neutral zinc metallopeptidase n=1 Tax=Micromonospora sp. NPDC005979 TaxID=3156726 RepID=UPI0033A1132C
MELNENAQVDTSQVEDMRGSGGGGGGGGLGIPIPGGGGRGGGLIGIIIAVVLALAGGGFGLSQLGGGGGSDQPADNSSLDAECSASATKTEDCRNTLFINSIQAYWKDAMPKAFGDQYQPATTRFFSNSVNTGCGQADSGVGPFYCPADKHVYIDLTFYDTLKSEFGVTGEFPQPYVLAHEYGHHVQDLLGTEAKAQDGKAGPTSGSVRLELQADCFAGAWANHATETKSKNDKAIFKSISEQDIQDAVDTAGAIGDDAIQQKSGQGNDPSSYTHGTAAQRQKWFEQGYNSGDPKTCDTFGTNQL